MEAQDLLKKKKSFFVLFCFKSPHLWCSTVFGQNLQQLHLKFAFGFSGGDFRNAAITEFAMTDGE